MHISEIILDKFNNSKKSIYEKYKLIHHPLLKRNKKIFRISLSFLFFSVFANF